MAIAGSATTTYQCTLIDDKLQVGASRMVASSICVKPNAALGILRTGQSVIVAGADMIKLRSLLEALNA